MMGVVISNFRFSVSRFPGFPVLWLPAESAFEFARQTLSVPNASRLAVARIVPALN